jgi:hypothetical protein
MKSFDFSLLAESWPSPIVSRDQVGKFTGGALNPRTLANFDSTGEGPKDRFKVGRKVCYPVDSLIEWLESRSSVVGP